MAQMNEQMTRVYDSILDDEERMIPRITESRFKREVLPIIANRSENADLRPWLLITNSWRRPIDVVDDQNQQQLFRVPALVGENKEPYRQKPTNSVAEIVETAKKKMEVVPKAGEEFLHSNLIQRIRADGNYHENLTQWNTIFRRYGLDHLIEQQESSSTSTTSSSSGDDALSFDGYDEA